MACNRYRGNGKRVREVEIQSDQSLGSALQQQPRIFVEKLWVVAMHTGHEEIIFLPRTVLDSCDNRGTVSIPDFVCDHANGTCSLRPDRKRNKVGPSVVRPGGARNTV